MTTSKSTWTAGWLLGCLALVCATRSAEAQDTGEPAAGEQRVSALRQRLRDADQNLERGLMRTAIEEFEGVITDARALRTTSNDHQVIRRLQRWEERAQLQIATAHIRMREPQLARRRLQTIERDESLSPAARQRARRGLEALGPGPAEEEETESGPIDLDVGTALLVAFGVLEAVLLSVGLGLVAAGWCEDPPGFMLTGPSCDHTVRDVGLGFAIAGSVWWIAPAIVGGVMGAARGGIGTSHPAASRGPAIVF